MVLECEKGASWPLSSKLGHFGNVVDHAHTLVRELLDCVGGVEGVGVLPNTARERQQERGNKAAVFGVDGSELAAVVGGEATNVYVGNFFQLEPEKGSRRERGKGGRGERGGGSENRTSFPLENDTYKPSISV